jgi:hypothetical protein
MIVIEKHHFANRFSQRCRVGEVTFVHRTRYFMGSSCVIGSMVGGRMIIPPSPACGMLFHGAGAESIVPSNYAKTHGPRDR